MFLTEMLFFVVLIMLTNCGVQSQPVGCNEDSHCPENYFCEDSTYTCHKCLDCLELNRSSPLLFEKPNCLKTDADCGPCLKGWNPHLGRHVTKCVPADPKSVLFLPRHIYIWFTCIGAALGFLIIIIHLYVLRGTSIFKIVRFYIPIPSVIAASAQWPRPGVLRSLSHLHPKPLQKKEHPDVYCIT